MIKIRTIYVACDFYDKYPILSADSFDNIRLALDEYCGANEKNVAKCLGFKPYEAKYADSYEGYFEYECCTSNDWNNTYIDKFTVYCIDFYPPTIDKV